MQNQQATAANRPEAMPVEGMRLSESDEYPHPLEAAENFNESVYWNVFDPAQRMGGWMRLGNRANEGYAEVSVCLYLPDGRVGFMYQRAAIAANDRFAAGGLHYEVVEPFARQRTSYSGEALLLSDATQLADPGAAFRDNPRLPCRTSWELTGISPLHGGEPTTADTPTLYGRDFSRGHFYQHIAVRGSLEVGGESWQLDGHGWRDHSWGPRYWQNIGFHRLLLANFGADAGFTLLKIAAPDGASRRHGVLLEAGRYSEIRDLDLLTEWDDHGMPRNLQLTARTAAGTEQIHGTVLSAVPLRNRRHEGGVELRTHITEAMTSWRWRGREGLGIIEYLDLVRDGRALGFPG